ncbi:hypothetical protein K493DRAFT_318446 [Basidiobolus meristosporus CBS 931.73]|uniref:Uncharacterized protein n=1 Tax=Basidiobolus meristosporus CBS 931.73 TaxID=1314790 RepID=A0A1Y1XVK8_9FUNG|nr:hypothetical protein K493DRAFT_318446 [Basidiobolus meristosporus CBS 931.73]|eukprot:ORX89788.1 hypothetical protein K493DRAFT_318446 [Basidiobolus meristosporus CBS 931.73]
MPPKKRLEAEPKTRVVSRANLYDDSSSDEEMLVEDTQENEAFQALMAKSFSLEAQQNSVPEEKPEEEEEEEEPEEIVFRLFNTPKIEKVKLAVPEPEPIVFPTRPESDDEFEVTDEMKLQFESVAITSGQIIEESKLPWERQFFLHKVIEVPLKTPKRKRIRKSKAKKEWEKKVAQGLAKPLPPKPQQDDYSRGYHFNRFDRKSLPHNPRFNKFKR